MNNYCSRCGNPLETGVSFCSKCGQQCGQVALRGGQPPRQGVTFIFVVSIIFLIFVSLRVVTTLTTIGQLINDGDGKLYLVDKGMLIGVGTVQLVFLVCLLVALVLQIAGTRLLKNQIKAEKRLLIASIASCASSLVYLILELVIVVSIFTSSVADLFDTETYTTSLSQAVGAMLMALAIFVFMLICLLLSFRLRKESVK